MLPRKAPRWRLRVTRSECTSRTPRLTGDRPGKQNVMMISLLSPVGLPQVVNTAAFPYVSAVTTGPRLAIEARQKSLTLGAFDTRPSPILRFAGLQRVAEYEQAAAAAEELARERRHPDPNAQL